MLLVSEKTDNVNQEDMFKLINHSSILRVKFYWLILDRDVSLPLDKMITQ